LLIVAILYPLGVVSFAGSPSSVNTGDSFLFSLYIGLLVSLSLFHSRLVSDPVHLFWPLASFLRLNQISRRIFWHFPFLFHKKTSGRHVSTEPNPILLEDLSCYPTKRLLSDLVFSTITLALVTALHATTLFLYINGIAFYVVAAIGVLNVLLYII